jgi:hypothetical protein
MDETWRGREQFVCVACRSHEEDVAGGPPPGPLCLPHLRRLAGRLAWDGLRRGALRLARALEPGGGRGLLEALWGNAELVGVSDGDAACEVGAEARRQQFEWLTDAVHRFPAQAAGAASAVCGRHAWWFAASSPGSGRVLADLAAEEWTRRLRWLVAGLEHRPPDRLASRVRALPATLARLADDEGRLHIAVILRATTAAVLRSPAAVLAQLTAEALRTEGCPVCAAEHRAASKVAASRDTVRR